MICSDPNSQMVKGRVRNLSKCCSEGPNRIVNLMSWQLSLFAVFKNNERSEYSYRGLSDFFCFFFSLSFNFSRFD